MAGEPAMVPDGPPVRVDRATVAVVTLNRPQALNAFDHALRSALTDALLALDADASVRAIVVTGAGRRAFSAGQDLHEVLDLQGEEAITGWMRHQQAMYQAVRDCRKPVVVACNGLAAGSGFHLGLMADFRIGHDGVLLGQPELRMGLASIIGPLLMSHHLPRHRISALTLGARMLNADEALRLGLLDECVPPQTVLDRAVALAGEVAAHPAAAVAMTKAWFVRTTQAAFDDAFDEVIRCHLAEFAAGVPQARIRAFLAARKPPPAPLRPGATPS